MSADKWPKPERQSYMRRVESRVVRTEHVVGFGPHCTAASIKKSLSKVPDSAVVLDVEEHETDLEWTYVVFLEEVMEGDA